MGKYSQVWIFHGEGARFSTGVFGSEEKARHWILHHKMTGVLTQYPVDICVYDWAIENNFFTPTKEHESGVDFIQGFTSGSQKHFHFEDGVED